MFLAKFIPHWNWCSIIGSGYGEAQKVKFLKKIKIRICVGSVIHIYIYIYILEDKKILQNLLLKLYDSI